MIQQILAIAWKDLQVLTRDRGGITTLFLMPIMFGALVDLTGIRSSAFMLMFGVVWVSLMWMYFTEVRPLEEEESHRHPEPIHFTDN